MTAEKNRNNRYHRFPHLKPASSISLYPQEAGKMLPVISNAFGSRLTGNIIPDSMMDGRNTSCDVIVSFA